MGRAVVTPGPYYVRLSRKIYGRLEASRTRFPSKVPLRDQSTEEQWNGANVPGATGEVMEQPGIDEDHAMTAGGH